MLETVKKSWKTTAAGLLIVVFIGLYLAKIIDGEQLSVAVSTLAGAGFIASKDGDKSGT
jgi:hypothetical protein